MKNILSHKEPLSFAEEQLLHVLKPDSFSSENSGD
jgi:hypothetical protein